MKAGTKTVLGIGAVGALGAALYFALKRRSTFVPSDASEWALPTFASTNAFLQQCVCPSGSTPSRNADGTCSCHEVSIEVLPSPYGRSCHTDAQCAVGVCINGSCRPESEWT